MTFGNTVRFLDLTMEHKMNDENDQLKAGTLPADPAVDTVPYNGKSWPELQPIKNEAVLPKFPHEQFSDWLQDYCCELAEETQTPVEMACMLGLACCATALAKKVVVNPWGNWFEPVNLYVAVALPPGERKSAVVKAMTAPLKKWSKDRGVAMRTEVLKSNMERRRLEQEVRSFEARAVKADEPQRGILLEKAVEAGQALVELPLISAPRLLVDDITTEGLVKVAHANKGRVAVLTSEGTIFSIMNGRYQHNVNYEVFLSGHTGEDWKVDRKNSEPLHVDDLTITLGVVVQPQVIRDLFDMPGAVEKGLFARFLYCFPTSKMGQRITRPTAMKAETKDAFFAGIQSLLESPLPDQPQTLVLNESAAEKFKGYSEQLEVDLKIGGSLYALRDWGGKLAGAVLRIAGILHLAKQVELSPNSNNIISRETIEEAIEIGRFLGPHAEFAYGAGLHGRTEARAEAILGLIKKNKWRTFRQSSVYEHLRSRFPGRKVKPMVASLDILEKRGYICRVVQKGPKSAGRPEKRFEVNFKVFENG